MDFPLGLAFVVLVPEVVDGFAGEPAEEPLRVRIPFQSLVEERRLVNRVPRLDQDPPSRNRFRSERNRFRARKTTSLALAPEYPGTTNVWETRLLPAGL